MLLQTWVENAIKHGIRYKEGVGNILVKIENLENNGIAIRVEDNGVGRAKAKEMGTTGNGQGLKILAEQVGIYNQLNSGKIILNTIDLVDEEGIVSGTRFEMTIPVSFNFDV
jgi:LytS/YehU family sensor histidine kinase